MNAAANLVELHEGGCVCGSIRYRVRGPSLMGIVCHCKFCQKRLATSYAVIAWFNDADVEFMQGTLTAYEHHSDESGRWLKIGFCGKCGTTLTHTAEVRPGFRAIAAGTFDDPDWFRVDRHIWTQSARPWVAIPADVEVYTQGSSGNAKPIER